MGNAKIKVQNAKLWNPDVVGMAVLLVGALFSISRILYLLDVYYTGWDVGCQVNSLVKREAYIVLRISYFVGEGTEGTERRLEKLAKFTAEIAEAAEEARGIEIRLRRGCLAGEGAIYSMKAVLEIGKKDVLRKTGRVDSACANKGFDGSTKLSAGKLRRMSCIPYKAV